MNYFDVFELMDEYKWYLIVPMALIGVGVTLSALLNEYISEYDRAQKSADPEMIIYYQKRVKVLKRIINILIVVLILIMLYEFIIFFVIGGNQ